MRGIVYGTALSFLLVSDSSARLDGRQETMLCQIIHGIMPLLSVRHCKKILQTERGRNCDSDYLGCYDVSLLYSEDSVFYGLGRDARDIYYQLRIEDGRCFGDYLGCYEVSLLYSDDSVFYGLGRDARDIYYQLRIEDGRCFGDYLGCYDVSLLYSEDSVFHGLGRDARDIYYQFRVSPSGG